MCYCINLCGPNILSHMNIWPVSQDMCFLTVLLTAIIKATHFFPWRKEFAVGSAS